ncbi:hypothetical protein M9Y10_017818 [Tritrichomonas musculus]|uniref:RING-type domain-containing protein n=1 Tax=Tritrichomonas musculus TaxID=1915356 RepID=A0ABR2HUP0_9EUKA
MLILMHHALMEFVFNFYRTPLHEAAERGSCEIVEALIDAGADVSKQNWAKLTPLHLAAKYGRIGAVQTLVEHNAPLDIQDSKGNTPLHCASQNNQSEIVSYLIANKANHLILNDEGYKAFQIAPDPLKSDVTEYVIENLMVTSKTRSLRLSQVLKNANTENDENENNETIPDDDQPILTPGKCIFCQATDPVFVYKPCGHVLLCDNCYINHKGTFENCPICDQYLERVESIVQPQEPEPITEEPPKEEEEKKEEVPTGEEEEEEGEKNGEEEAGEISTEGESYAESAIEST